MQNLSKETLKIYWQHQQRFKRLSWLCLLSVTLSLVAELYQPQMYKQLLNGLASHSQSQAFQLIRILFLILAVNLTGWFFARAASFLDTKLTPAVKSDLANTCFAALHTHSFNFFNNNFSGSLVRKANRYTKSFDEIHMQMLWNIGPGIFSIFSISAILYFQHWQLSILLLLWSFVYIFLNYRFSLYKLKFDAKRAEADSKVSGHLSDTISNHLNLKLFGGYLQETQTYAGYTDQLRQSEQKSWNLNNYSQAFQGLMMIFLDFGLMYLAIIFWRQGQLSLGDFALLQGYILQIANNLWGIGRYIRQVYEALADAQEMTQILLDEPEVVDTPKARPLRVRQGEIAFQKVDFAYSENRTILEDFNLRIKPGERVALIGPSGGGKSTLVKLLFRFSDLNGGKIMIDGQNIAKVSQESLRAQLSLVPQEPLLFHRSILENIRYAKPEASLEEVITAAKAAHCHEFISHLADGYETFVGERGVKLSGGERQRVAIARAILKNAPILVLDEATSSLDSESEQYIQEALSQLMKGKTVIVIAHRLSTIMQMDTIFVLEAGKIVEAGSHQELLQATQGTYQKLWQIQAGGFKV